MGGRMEPPVREAVVNSVKLGTITSGISQDLETALQVMVRDGIEYAELMFIWDTEICHHSDEQYAEMKRLLDAYGIKVGCIMKHVLNGLPVLTTQIEDDEYQEQLRLLRKSIELARYFGTNITRIQPFAKQNIIFGEGGAGKHFASGNRAWGRFLRLLEPCCEIAEETGIDMMIETGANTFIHTAALARKAIDELGCSHLKILWDPANCLYSMETPPEGYEQAAGYLADVHIKDLRVDRRFARLTCCPVGTGEMAPYLREIAELLKRDRYDGVVTFENQMIPEGLSEAEGWDLSIRTFKEIFG